MSEPIDVIDEYNFMHCIRPFCFKKLNPPWDNYVVNRNEVRQNPNVLKIYKCPYCAIEWTVKDAAFNDVLVNGFDPSETFIICDIIENEITITGIIGSKNVIKIKEDYYLHVPNKFINSRSRMFAVPNELSEDEEKIKEYIMDALKETISESQN